MRLYAVLVLLLAACQDDITTVFPDDLAAGAGDAVTADLLTALAAQTDKQLWMVEAHQS